MKLHKLAFTLIALCLSAPLTASACKCRPLGLKAYFDNADFVFVAKLSPSNASYPHSRTFNFELAGASYKGKPSALRDIVTASSSAECGIAINTDDSYLIFGMKTELGPQTARISTCSGTRNMSQFSDQVADFFVDTPNKYLMQQLAALSAATAPGGLGGVALDNSALGLLAKPPNSQGHAAAKAIDLYSFPDASSKLIAHEIAPHEIEMREISYEQNSFIVYGVSKGWYRLKTKAGVYGWYHAEFETYFPLPELLMGRLSYLTDSWDGRIWPDPGAGIPLHLKVPADDSLRHVEIERSTQIAGSHWVKLKLYRNDLCSGSESKVAAAGWVPLWNPQGLLTLWFWSRGC